MLFWYYSRNRKHPFELQNGETTVSVDSDGFRLPSVERQGAELERRELAQEALEQELASPPSDTVAAAMEMAEDAHRAEVALEIANATFSAKVHDAAEQAARHVFDVNPHV